MKPGLAAGILAAVLLAARPVAADISSLNGGASAAHLRTANVFGTEPSPGDGITDGRGWLSWRPSGALRFSANGRLVRFQDNDDLNHGYATVAAEAAPGAIGGAVHVQAGVANSWRRNGALYEPFNYRDTSAYLTARRHLTQESSAQFRLDLAAREYPEQPTEDSHKAWLSLRLQRSFPTRTSLTLSARTGWKDYQEEAQTDAAVRELSVQAAQSLSTRVAVRGWGSLSDLYEHGDATDQLAAFDNPLLDEFSFDGRRAGGGIKVIMPWNLVVDVSGERAWLDYPGRPPALYDPVMNRFVVDGGLLVLDDGQRSDAVTRARLQLERRGTRLASGARLDLTLAVEWSEQDSNDLYWQWHGWSVQGGASVEF